MKPTVEHIAAIHVLLVEDEPLICDWVAEILSGQGFLVHTARNANEALRYLATEVIDVLITDVNLPGAMDGAALARRARELRQDLPVVYAAARAPDDLVAGAVFVPKPYEPALLGRLITAAFATKRGSRSRRAGVHAALG